MNKAHLVISSQNDLLRILPMHILYLKADGNYCYLQTKGEMRMLTQQLGQVEDLIGKQLPPDIAGLFVRIGRSLIVNSYYIYSINIPKQQLIMVDIDLNPYVLSASKEALKELKEFIEKGVKK